MQEQLRTVGGASNVQTVVEKRGFLCVKYDFIDSVEKHVPLDPRMKASHGTPGRSTSESRRRSSFLRRCRTRHSSSAPRTTSPAAVWRRTRSRLQPPAKQEQQL